MPLILWGIGDGDPAKGGEWEGGKEVGLGLSIFLNLILETGPKGEALGSCSATVLSGRREFLLMIDRLIVVDPQTL